MSNDELHERFGVTGEQLDAWADEYESADWSQMRFGEVIKGRPKFSDEPLDSSKRQTHAHSDSVQQ